MATGPETTKKDVDPTKMVDEFAKAIKDPTKMGQGNQAVQPSGR
jgi:hypothetical protein